MSQQTIEEKALEVVRESQALIARAARQIEENTERMRTAGLDPAKVRALGPADLDDEHRRQLEAQLNALQEEIERNAQHAADAQGGSDTPRKTRRPRDTI
jgi:hypothetical protein